jgi:hypothetical protein
MKEELKKLIYHLKKSEMIKDMVKYIDKEIPITIFPKACKENLTINQHLHNIEDCVKQHTVISTGRISYDGVKSYLVYQANNFFGNYIESKIKIISIKELTNEDFINKSFDVIFEIDGVRIALEVKVTQQKKGWTGATHSTSKVPDYLLISLSFDRDKIVESNTKFVNGVFCMIYSFDKENWVGKPKENSSFTSLELKSYVDYSEGIICGNIKKNKKNCELMFENI